MPLKIEFGKDRGMTPEQVDKWMRDTRRMFRAAVEKRLEAAEKVDTDSVPVAIPEGWQLVPMEPTANMYNAFNAEIEEFVTLPKTHQQLLAIEGYKAMLHAASRLPQKDKT